MVLDALLRTDDPHLRQAMAEAAGPGCADDVRWLDADGGRCDLLIVDRRGSADATGNLPPSRLLILVVDAESLRRPGSADELSAAADLVVWPGSAEELSARWRLWRDRIAQLRTDDPLGRRGPDLEREGSVLQRQLARQTSEGDFAARAPDELRRLTGRFEAITRLSRQINSLELGQIVELCIQRIPSLFAVRLASFYYHDAAKAQLRLLSHNHPYPINSVVPLASGSGPLGPMALAALRRQLLLIDGPDWTSRPELPGHRPYAYRYATGACVIAPMIGGDRVMGVLNLADRKDGEPFDELADLIPIRQLSELLGASLNNIELYHSAQARARIDGLTGLANRATFNRELSREMNRATRYGTPLSLTMIDVDSLKRINDNLGHPAGDRALRRVADTIAQSVRDSDLPARYGGDEFAVVLPSTTLHAARAVAERILATITATPLDGGQHLTVSLGLGQLATGDASADALVQRVDAALYQAKQHGRNRIEVCV